MARTIDWGFSDNSSEAPYFINFDCYDFARTSSGRADIINGAGNPIQSIILPGCAIGRGSSHRYSEDSTMAENLGQALSTIDESFASLQDASGSNTQDLVEQAEKQSASIALRYQQDNFAHINSTLGRIEMLTTETAYLGSSKRKYNFYWNLKSTSRGTSDSDRAAFIAETFETLSLPVVGRLGEGAISAATRMEPPPIWTFNALDVRGNPTQSLTKTWLGNPKPCILQNVLSNVDNQSFYYQDGSKPFSYNLTLSFVELENVLNADGMVSRSEYFRQIGSG
tara:strand:+ start:4025 stop:4870 length:846 start_codon:yes stop_codon:yes gene_type:complete